MGQRFIPFYMYNERDRLGYSLILDFKTMHIYRQYEDNASFFKSGKYWVYYFLTYWTLSALKGWNFFASSFVSLALLGLVIVISFWLGYFFIYKRSIKKANLREAFLTTDEFIAYAKQGKKMCLLLIFSLMITLLILIVTVIYYVFFLSILSLIFISFISFLSAILMRTIPLRRLQLNFNDKYLQQIADMYEQTHQRSSPS